LFDSPDQMPSMAELLDPEMWLERSSSSTR
jgi:hypothetical protein